MHESVLKWVEGVVKEFTPQAPVLEVGSCDVNGSVRGLFPEPYLGVDVVAGKGVDQVVSADAPLPFDDEAFETVVSTECLEHCLDPVDLLDEMVRVLRPGGTLIISMRGNGFGRHNPPDRWRVMPGTLYYLLASWGLEDVAEVQDPQVSGSFVVAHKARPCVEASEE